MAVVFCSNCGAGNTSGGKFCSACGQKLQQEAAPTPASLTGLLPSHTLLKQRYRILQSIGKGGMGAVYMAQDNNLGDRLVAVKEMSQAMLSPQEAQEASENFKKEAYLLAGLHHPNLPSIHDHFEEQGRWYLVMSFIEGETLGDYKKGKPGEKVSLEEGLQIGLALCDVLDYLHTHAPPIIFRDLKPSNIMRTSQGRIYLIDFGIARHFKPGQTKDTANYGSAGYSPPEQYGHAQTSPRSDIYSLGVTLYTLLSGYAPSLSPFRLPPLQSQVPGLPPRLVTLITRMLSLDEGQRPDSVKEVKQELTEIATPNTNLQAPTLIAVTDPYASSNQYPIANPYASPSYLQETLIPSITPPPPPVKGPSNSRRIFAFLGMTLGFASTFIGIVGTTVGFSDISQQKNYAVTYYDLSLGSLFLFFGLLLALISMIREKGLPLSIANRVISVLGIIVGSIACLYTPILIIDSLIHSLFDDLTYNCISLMLGIIIIIATRPRK